MADLSKLEVELSIQEREISKIKKGQRCRVQPEAYMDRYYDGVVSRLMPIADRAKGAVPVRVRLKVPADEEGQFLRPEMGAIVKFYSDIVDDEYLPAQTKFEKMPPVSSAPQGSTVPPGSSDTPAFPAPPVSTDPPGSTDTVISPMPQ